MNEKYLRQMKKGVLDMLIMKLLQKGEKYGYQLISELREKSGDLFVLKEGTLYPILYRLEDDGLVESNWSGPKGKRMARKYYRLTEKGREALDDIMEIWKNMCGGIARIMEE